MHILKVNSFEEYQRLDRETWNARIAFEKKLGSSHLSEEKWYINGYCHCCRAPKRFLIDWLYSDRVYPNYRERLVCESCNLNNRQRYAIHEIDKYLRGESQDKIVYCYEQITPFYNYLKKRFPKNNVIGSEYLGFEFKSGEVIKGIRHEDAMALSFEKSTIDIIISNDVYEHVPDFQKSIEEVYRILKPNGMLLFSIPFNENSRCTEPRAMIIEKKLKYLKEPQYHGNPLLKEGSLVFNDFGWDLLETIRKVGFLESYMIIYYDLLFGYIGNGKQFVFCAMK